MYIARRPSFLQRRSLGRVCCLKLVENSWLKTVVRALTDILARAFRQEDGRIPPAKRAPQEKLKKRGHKTAGL